MFDNFWRKLLDCSVLYISAAFIILLIFLFTHNAGIGFYVLTKDPFAGQAHEIPIYTSVLSNFGIMAWCSTVSTQYFAAWITHQQRQGSQAVHLLYWSGTITLLLMLDDFLMLHERLNHTAETIIFGVYGILVASVMLEFRVLIFRSNYLILAAALLCFLLSMGLDNVVTQLSIEIPYRTLLEDIFKIFGIIGWAYYFIRLSIVTVKDVLSSNQAC